MNNLDNLKKVYYKLILFLNQVMLVPTGHGSYWVSNNNKRQSFLKIPRQYFLKPYDSRSNEISRMTFHILCAFLKKFDHNFSMQVKARKKVNSQCTYPPQIKSAPTFNSLFVKVYSVLEFPTKTTLHIS